MRHLKAFGVDDRICVQQNIAVEGPRTPSGCRTAVAAMRALNGKQCLKQCDGRQAGVDFENGIEVIRLRYPAPGRTGVKTGTSNDMGLGQGRD